MVKLRSNTEVTTEIFKPLEPQIELDYVQEASLSVSLADRAVAIEGIMAYLNKNNMTKGSRTQLPIEDSPFNQRYGEAAPDVQEGAEENRKKLFDGFVKGIHILNASDAKRQLGYDAEDIRLQAISLKKTINDEYLPAGKSRHRARAVKKAKKLAIR